MPSERAAPANHVPEHTIHLWLIDTGCGHDLVSRKEIAAVKDMVRKAQHTIILHTANGKVVARDAIDMFVKELGQNVEPYVLDTTPAVLSVGLRCMEMGFTFIWPPGKNPYFVTPSKQIIQLEVKNNVP